MTRRDQVIRNVHGPYERLAARILVYRYSTTTHAGSLHESLQLITWPSEFQCIALMAGLFVLTRRWATFMLPDPLSHGTANV